MISDKQNSTGTFFSALCKAGLVVLCLLILLPASAQNTKGDKPGGRENRFSPFKKKGSQKRKGPSGKRVKSKGKSPSNSGIARFFSRKGGSVSAKHKNVFSQRGPFVHNPSRTPKNKGREKYGRPIRPIINSKPSERQRFRSGDISGHRIRAKTSPGRSTNIYPQRGPFVHNPSRKPRKMSRPVSNRTTLARVQRLQSPGSPKPGKKRKIIPRSASGSFVARRPNNNWKRFPQVKRKGEVAYTRDIAGRRLRTKNYETKRPGIVAPSLNPYFGRKRVGDRPNRGAAPKGRNYSSKGRRTEYAGQPVIPLFRIKPQRGDRVYRGTVPGRRPRSASQPGEKRTGKAPLPPRGIGAIGTGFKGSIKARKPAKGGGSVSGRAWNNRGQPLAPRVPGVGADRVSTFQGNLKSRRPPKGGGSVSGKPWNNRRTPIAVRPPSGQGMKAGGYPGRIKRFQVQPGFSDQGEEFTGYKKARKPPKGGGSVSGKLWNNKRQPIEGKTVGPGALRVGAYQGNIKAGRPAKGGGSVSGKLWNNKQTPIPVRTPPAGAEKAAKYPGKIKRFSVQPGFSDQGEEFTGVIKRPWYRRSYSRNPNAHEKAVKQQSPSKTTYQVGNLHIAVKQRKYVKNPNASEDALRKQSPTKSTEETGDLQVKMKRAKYVKNPNSADEALRKLKPSKTTFQVSELQVKVKKPATGKKPHGAEGALPGIKPTKETIKASEYSKGARRNWDYVRNPSSARDALRVREPGKAFARATDYQGNIKMRKFELFGKSELHPDAKFVKTNKNNVAAEKGLFTNIKLWWAKTFKKNDNQPDHLKEKGRKPRYDKGEQGMWND